MKEDTPEVRKRDFAHHCFVLNTRYPKYSYRFHRQNRHEMGSGSDQTRPPYRSRTEITMGTRLDSLRTRYTFPCL
ncbi:hypothetical protein Hanom_Chr08g00730701 [Helianthus anomalus]